MKITATTRSGTVYTIENGYWTRTTPEGASWTARYWSLRIGDRATITSWSDVHQWPQTEVPEVGKSMYFDSNNDWQLSTEVVSVEIEEDA